MTTKTTKNTAILKPVRKTAASRTSAAGRTRAARATSPEVVEVVSAKTPKYGLRRPTVMVLSETDDIVKEQVGGFVTFIREHAIVGLAVGFVVGQQAQGVVKQIVTSIVEPIFNLFFGGAKLSERFVTVHLFGNTAKFGLGALAAVLINLIFVLLVIYILIKVFKLDKLDKPKEAVAEAKKATKKKPAKKTAKVAKTSGRTVQKSAAKPAGKAKKSTSK